MLFYPPGTNSFGSSVKSWGTTRPAAAFGASVTPGAGSKGSRVQLFAATSAPSYGIHVCINNNNTSATARGTVVDIGVDPAGGTSYTVRIADSLGGSAVGYTTGSGGLYFYFPLYIPAGATIGVRANSTVATAFNVCAVLSQKPTRPALVRQAAYVDTFGISGNAGTSITPGTTAEGAWTLIGTTTRRLWWWQAGFQVAAADTSWNSTGIHLDLAVGDATNKDIIISDALYTLGSVESIGNFPITVGCERDVSSGTNIYMRAQCSGTLDSYTCAAYAAGG